MFYVISLCQNHLPSCNFRCYMTLWFLQRIAKRSSLVSRLRHKHRIAAKVAKSSCSSLPNAFFQGRRQRWPWLPLKSLCGMSAFWVFSSFFSWPGCLHLSWPPAWHVLRSSASGGHIPENRCFKFWGSIAGLDGTFFWRRNRKSFRAAGTLAIPSKLVPPLRHHNRPCGGECEEHPGPLPVFTVHFKLHVELVFSQLLSGHSKAIPKLQHVLIILSTVK